MRLTVIRVVTCVTHGWLFVQTERGQSVAYLKMVSSQERLYLNIMSHIQLEKYVWIWLVNKDDWTRRLGHCRFQSWTHRLTWTLSYEVKSAEVCWMEGLSQSLWHLQSMVPTLIN